MTLDQFKTKYLGKKVDFDNYAGGQCVDLARFYWQEVINIPQPKGVVGAADFWTNFPTDPALNLNHEKIPNTPSGVPQKGDIIIWSKATGGGYGHIAIFLEGDGNSFTSLDQNWPTLSKVTKTKHNYTNVLGWLRPKKGNMSELEVCLADRKRFWEERDAEIVAHKQTQVQLEQAKKDRDRYRDERNSARAELELLKKDYELLAEDLRECQQGAGSVKIDSEVKIAGSTWVINGLEVRSDGLVVGNYRIK